MGSAGYAGPGEERVQAGFSSGESSLKENPHGEARREAARIGDEETWLQVRLGGSYCLTAFLASLPCVLAWSLDLVPDTPLGRAATMLPGLVVALLVGGFVGRRLHASLQPVMRVAEAVARGERSIGVRQSGPAGALVDPRGAFPALGRAVNRMADRIGLVIQASTERQERLQAILNGMREGVMALDGRGRVEAVNPALEVIAGAKADKLLGRTPLEALMCPELDAACEAMLMAQEAESMAQSGPSFRTMQVELRDGRTYDVSLVRAHSAMPETFESREGRTGKGSTKVVAVFHDVSEMRRLERMRRDFVANVSHELRTPLTSIKGYAETLLLSAEAESGYEGEGVRHSQSQCADAASVRSFLEVILKNANHMAKMVDDLLNLARLEAGRQHFNIVRTDAAASLQAALRESAPLAHSRRIVVDNRLESGKVFVMADADRLTQVFRNLLENAFRYGPENSTVTVDHELHEDGAAARFSVRDEGPGVPESERQRIFERFYRLEKHRVKNAGSSGLGLAIAKHIVERMGGRISVAAGEQTGAAKTGKTGAVFSFTTPIVPAEDAVGPAEDVSESSARNRPEAPETAPGQLASRPKPRAQSGHSPSADRRVAV